MEGSGKTGPIVESYKAIPETDLEEEAIQRPKSLLKGKSTNSELDGADEKMLPEKEDKKVTEVAPVQKNLSGASPGSDKQNGDAKLDIDDAKEAFVGLTKEELMKYANDPFWVRLRWFLFLTFWALWLAMLLGAVLIIYAAPKCNPPPPKTWWEQGPLTEVNTDVELEQLKNLKDIGVQGIFINYPEDTYIDLDEDHTFTKLLKNAKDQDINLIVELEPGTSEIWFNQSVQNISDYYDYYIWKKPKMDNNNPLPPNNWRNIKNQSSWIYHEDRKEYYYAPTGKPHLNLRNPNVTEQFTNVLQRLIKYGASGFRLRRVANLLVDTKFADEPLNPLSKGFIHTDYGFYSHSKTENLPELATLLKPWYDTVKTDTNNGPFTAVEDIGSNIESYKLNGTLLIDIPLKAHAFNKLNANDIVKALEGVYNADGISWPLWKYNSNSVLDMVVFLLPGVPLIEKDTTLNSELLKIRDSASIMRGNLKFLPISNSSIFGFIREKVGNPGILVLFNPMDATVKTDLDPVTTDVTVQLVSSNYNEPNVAINVKISPQQFPLSPNSAVVLSFVSNA